MKSVSVKTLKNIKQRLRPPEHIGSPRLRHARDRACAYVLKRQRRDGGMLAHPKALSAFQVCGYSRAADRVCAWIRQHNMGPNGLFIPRLNHEQGHNQIYPTSWITIGAHRLGQFDISQSGMDFLIRCRDARTGGFYETVSLPAEEAIQELIYVGFCGLAALHTGYLDVARGVGNWMQTVMSAQPNFPRKLYTVYSRAQGLHTDPPPDQAIRYVVSSQATGDQFFFQPGVAGGFLARLFQATGEDEWLALAIEYMRFAEAADDHLFRLPRAGKVGWAAAILYTLTGTTKYREMAVRVGQNLIAAQSRSGYWQSLEKRGASIGLTAATIVWLDEIYQAVYR